MTIERGALAADFLYRGDIIVAVNRQPVRNPADARRIADGARTVTLEIERASRPKLVRIR
jgi:S1-C subfamily serine protease